MTVIADGIEYKAEKLNLGPNSLKYNLQAFGLIGPRGASYYLTQGINGLWHMLAISHGLRAVWPKNVEVKEI